MNAQEVFHQAGTTGHGHAGIGSAYVGYQLFLHPFHHFSLVQLPGERRQVEVDDGVLVQVLLKRRVLGNLEVGEESA